MVKRFKFDTDVTKAILPPLTRHNILIIRPYSCIFII